MYLIFCLNVILTDFSPLFKSQNFHLFCVFVVGLIKQREGATLTGIYQAVRPKTGYHSLMKFLSRGKWDADRYNGLQYSGHELSKIYRLTDSHTWRSEYVNQTDSSYSEVQVYYCS